MCSESTYEWVTSDNYKDLEELRTTSNTDQSFCRTAFKRTQTIVQLIELTADTHILVSRSCVFLLECLNQFKYH